MHVSPVWKNLSIQNVLDFRERHFELPGQICHNYISSSDMLEVILWVNICYPERSTLQTIALL